MFSLKKVFVLICMVTFFSCEKRIGGNTLKVEKRKDSSLFFFHLSKADSLSFQNKRHAINRAFSFSRDMDKDSLYSKILYEKNFIHFSLKEFDSLKFFNQLLINHSTNIKDKRILAKQYYLMGYYFDEFERTPDSAFQNYNLSKNNFIEVRDSSWAGRNLSNMAIIQKNQNDFFGSKETLTEALQYLDLKEDIRYIASCFNVLATSHRKLLNYEDAIEYYLKAIEITNDERDKFVFQNNLAASYIDNKQFRQAIKLLEEIAQNSLLKDNLRQYSRVLDNLAYAQWLSGENTSQTTFKKPLKIRKQNNDDRGLIASYTHLGEFYSKANPTRAELYFDSVIQLSKTLKIPRAEKDALKFLMKLRPNDVRFRDRYIFLQDSLYVQELKVKTQFAKYKYDDKLKQESILRLEKENAEKALEASRQRTQKIMYLGGFLFAASVLGLSMYGFRQRTKRLKQKNKTARLEATYETEEELSRRLHDDHGGKLNHTILLVQNDADKSVILDNLEGLYNQSRDFSREINEVDTGPNYKDELLGMLGSRKPPNTKLFTTGFNDYDWSVVPELTKTTLFKVLQELMINMGKHSGANTIVISLQKKNKVLKIDYEDDGVGASKKELRAKNGLRNTEKRIQAINGTITFDSEKGNGFRAEILVPY